ncbi:DUF3572 family protein [Novosphingobium sp. FSY-8]|uniref:DUF3572 family protein n=1 Tax=Novosphingobium ovatum TaxID=1908523 RepID=A0ABW9XGJ7_9SPHN|nr:DUF3572 family protein [Novosphingobium ovatum]
MALAALGWVLSDEDHAQRLLALTGITPDELRERLGERDVLVAVLDFLMAHEPDLLACAEALEVTASDIARAHAALNAMDQDTDWGA